MGQCLSLCSSDHLLPFFSCLLSLVSCLLSPVSYLLSLVSCLLPIAYCLLSLVSCFLSLLTSHLLPLATMPLFLILALVPLLALGHYGNDHQHAVGHTHHGCYPSPCHYNARCRDGGNAVACVCRPGFTGDGVNTCRRSPPPPPRNPCIGACGYNAHCKVVNNVAACACPAGYTGNPAHQCHHHH